MNLEEKKKFIINFAYFLVLIIIGYFLFKVAAIYLLPFLIGIIIAYVVQKPAAFISQKTKFKKQNCAGILSILVFVVVIIFISLIGWFLYIQLSKLISYFSSENNNISQYIEKLYTYIESLIQKTEFNSALKKFSNDTINGFIAKISVFLSNGVASFIKNLPTLLITCVVTIVATCYISKDYERLLKFAKGFLNERFYKRVVDIKNVFAECFLKFILGYFWLFLITFSELFVGFLLLGVKHYFILAFLVAFLDMLPVIGTGTILLPWAIVMFFQNDYKLGFGVVILYLIITVIRNFAEPKIIGKQIGINPLFTLVFIFLGLRLGGIMGMLVLPVVLTVLFTYFRRQILDNN